MPERKTIQENPVSKNAAVVLGKRYLRPGETADDLFRRCSMGNEAYYKMLSSLDFLPNSPTLFNLGTGQGTLSACFKFNIKDSMGSIVDVGSKAIWVQKYGGGVGFELSQLRPRGTKVSSTHGKAMGPVGVLRWLHAGAKMVTQGGKREGAQMGILRADHQDIREFIHCKDSDPQSLSTFNISVALPDSFMAAAKWGKLPEYSILEEMAFAAWRTGDPGCFFVDTAEAKNPTPHLGKLDGTNPCGEVPLLDNEACNLGSINLSHFVTEGIDFDRLGNTTRLAVRYLDEVLDNNWFPKEEITEAVAKTRKLGLGVMGWADMLMKLHIHYDSVEAVCLGERLMKFINETARSESQKLAVMKGAYPGFWNDGIGKGSEWRRNATVTCIAPTGSIALIADCSSGIEPHFDTHWIREMGDGTLIEESVDVDGFIPHISRDIDWKWHLQHQAAFQKHTDLAVSKTINMPNSVTPKDILDAYIMAWELGCTGVTVYRDGSRDKQVLNSMEVWSPEKANDFMGATGAPSVLSVTMPNGNVGSTPDSLANQTPTASTINCPECQRALVFQEGCESCVSCGYSACSV